MRKQKRKKRRKCGIRGRGETVVYKDGRGGDKGGGRGGR